MESEFLRKLFTTISSFAILLQSLSPIVAITPQVAYAQEVTASPTPADPTPTVDITPAPTDEVSPTPEVTTTPTVTPEETVTPVPTDAPIDTVAPTTEQAPSQSNENSNPSQAPPTSAATETPTATPDNTSFVPDANVNTTILKNVSAPSLDLSTDTTSSATLTTDKADYAPTDTALIGGSNFAANKTYSLTVSSTDAPTTSTTVSVTTDADGGFVYAYQLDGTYRPNYSVVVKDGQTTAATTSFTDGPVFGPTAAQNIACMGDQPTAPKGLTCTANDIQLASVDNIHITRSGPDINNLQPTNSTQCDYPGQWIEFTASWHVLSTATSRYNVGLWFAQGQSSALHGTCSASTLPNNPTPPFFEDTDDTCGDIHSGTTGVVSPAITVVAQCTAAPGTSQLNLPYCTSWDNNEQAGNACNSPEETVPGTPSKCNCQNANPIAIIVPPGIEVVKDLNPASDSGKFNLQVNGSTAGTGANVGDNGTTGQVSLIPGNQTFGESAGTATSLSDYTSSASCVLRGTQTVVTTTGSGPTWTIPNVANGQDIVCTITNTRNNGTIELKKIWSGLGGQTTLNIGTSIAGTQVASVQTGTEGAVPLTTGTKTVNTGTYYVSENGGLTNYTSALACTDNGNAVVPGTNNSLSVMQGHTVICTFTNSIKRGTMIVKKVMVGGVDTFTFTGSPSGTIQSNNGTITVQNVLPGTYTSTETALAGWDLTGLSCNDSESATPSTTNGSTATFKVDPSETVTCTFTNTKKGHLIVQKTTNPSQDATVFNVLATGSGTITNGGSGTVTDATDKNYEVTPGTYSVTESATAGWHEDSNDCNNIVIAAGATEHCTIVNTKLGNVTVVKFLDENANGFKASDEAKLDDWEIHLGQMSQFTGAQQQGQVTFSDVYPGQFVLSEQLQAGYLQSNIYCGLEEGIDNDNAHTVNLSAGQNITCYIGNYQKTHITVVKRVVDPDGNPVDDTSTNFDFFATGQNPFTLTDDQEKSFDVNPGNYDVVETLNANYTGDGCTAVYDGESVGVPINQEGTQGKSVSLDSGDSVTVTCVNKQKQGEVGGFKWNDLNGNARFDCQGVEFLNEVAAFDQLPLTCEPKLQGWTIYADLNGNESLDNGEPSTTTDVNGNYTLNLNPGEYSICEVGQPGWAQMYPSDPICHSVTIGSNETVEGSRNFGNQQQTPVLTITKTNDKLGVDQHTGDSVLYTLTLSASDAAAANVVLTDLLPKGFAYRDGSATLDTGDGSGPQPFSNFADDYHSPGIWNLPNMNVGQTFTLTLIADITGDVHPGDYPDVAWAQGTPVSDPSTVVLATAVNPGFVDENFVGTHVNVVQDIQDSVTLSPKQEVLGAALLPETGGNALWIAVGILFVLFGGSSLGYGIILARKNYGKTI